MEHKDSYTFGTFVSITLATLFIVFGGLLIAVAIGVGG